jgi:hypothetical protein
MEKGIKKSDQSAGVLRRDDCLREHRLPNRMVPFRVRGADDEAQGQVVLPQLPRRQAAVMGVSLVSNSHSFGLDCTLSSPGTSKKTSRCRMPNENMAFADPTNHQVLSIRPEGLVYYHYTQWPTFKLWCIRAHLYV